MNLSTPLHDGMICCGICKHQNIFTERDEHPIIAGAARCHWCGNLTPISGTIIDLLGPLTGDQVEPGVTFGVPTVNPGG